MFKSYGGVSTISCISGCSLGRLSAFAESRPRRDGLIEDFDLRSVAY